MDLDNLLYIILMIVAFVVSVVRKNKKAQNRPRIIHKDNAESRKTPFQSFNIEQILNEEQDLLDDENLNTEKEMEQGTNSEILDTVPKYTKEREILSNIENQDISKGNDSFAEKDIPKSKLTKEKEFDLREAIIYSEILKRKEF
ncbi:MAG: hypothetical protein MI739_14065 [Bacteroidales bacterium]|nr:hypothetical protein [Bacteroidales bacterium]